MLYMIGGAPRSGKTILAQRFATRQGTGWISTDLLLELLRLGGAQGAKTDWNADPQAIAQDAAWFFPYLQRFMKGIRSQGMDFLIERVDFLPSQVDTLAKDGLIRAVFLGCSRMTKERFDRFPGGSPGYARLPDDLRKQMAADIPRWSAFIQAEAVRYG
jgi:hypothetical protein